MAWSIVMEQEQWRRMESCVSESHMIEGRGMAAPSSECATAEHVHKEDVPIMLAQQPSLATKMSREKEKEGMKEESTFNHRQHH